jgi:hypothetical protein
MHLDHVRHCGLCRRGWIFPMQTARQKVVLDLFEKRFEVYNDLQSEVANFLIRPRPRRIPFRTQLLDSAFLTVVKVFVSCVPTAVSATIITTEISAASSPYSMAVAPASSWIKEPRTPRFELGIFCFTPPGKHTLDFPNR